MWEIGNKKAFQHSNSWRSGEREQQIKEEIIKKIISLFNKGVWKTSFIKVKSDSYTIYMN